MAALNRYEQSAIDAYEALEARRRAGENVGDFELNRARQVAEQQRENAELREQRIAQLQVDKTARVAAHQLAADQQALAAQETYKRLASASFPGTHEQFEAAWPELLRAWQIRNALDDRTVEAEAARRLSPMLEY